MSDLSVMLRKFDPRIGSGPMTREYEIAHLDGQWITKRVVAGDVSEAAEKLFPCARGIVLARVVATGERFQLHRDDQLKRWEMFKGGEGISVGPLPFSEHLKPTASGVAGPAPLPVPRTPRPLPPGEGGSR